MYRRYELPAELSEPYLYKDSKSSGMATEPPQVGDMVTFRVGGLAAFDLVVEAVGDGTVKGVVVNYSGYFVEPFPRTFSIGDKLEMDTDAAFILRRAGKYVRP